MNQGPFHPWSDHEPLPTPGTLVNTQHSRDGNRSMAVGTIDGHASSSLIDNEVITAGLTFEEDIGHLLTPRGDTVSI
jgi:hypothetical protein